MRVYLFEVGEEVIINANAIHGLPFDVGKKVIIEEQLDRGLYEYIVRFDDGTSTKVREKELTKIDNNDPIYGIQLGDTYTNIWDETGQVIKIDYHYRQVEIKYSNGTYQVVSAEIFLDQREE